jgi:hypothetical protein
MAIEKELERLVKRYATKDPTNNQYVSQLNENALLGLDRDFCKLINQQLLLNGPQKEKITRQYRKISRYFHPDHGHNFLPEVIWIEQNLSQGRNDGACFKSLLFNYEKLASPENFKDIHFEDIKTDAELRKWLENLRDQSGTYTGRCLYDSLIHLLDQAGGFWDETGHLRPKNLRFLIRFIPMIFVTYGSVIFAEELFAVYALYFLMLKGGQYLEKDSIRELQQVGRTLQDITSITATATTTFMVRLLEMTFWASRQCLDITLQIGSVILHPIMPVSPEERETPSESAMNLCRDLICASKIPKGGKKFQTPELKIISAPIESYSALNAQQFLGNWRAGNAKRIAIEAFLFSLGVLDQLQMPIETKLIEAQKELEKIKKNKEVFNSCTKRAVLESEHVIALLKEPDEIRFAESNASLLM